MAAKAFEEGAGTEDALVGAAVIDDLAFADHIVGDDYRAWTGELECPVQIRGIVGFIGVEEDEVERSGFLLLQFSERVERGTDADIDDRREAGAVNISLRYRGVFRV